MSTLSYSFYGHDNDSYMFIDGHPFSCSECGSRLINTYYPAMKLRKKTFDVSSTYDGYTIVSKKFVDFLIKKKYRNLNIHPLINHLDFFYFDSLSLPVLEFDTVRRKVEYTGACKTCEYNPAYGSTPTYLKDIYDPIEKGFYRTNILFSDPGKERPQKIIGIETYKELRSQKFKGMDLRAIEK